MAEFDNQFGRKMMNGLKQLSLALATAGLLTSGMAQAALNDRGGGLLYDDVLNVTWLQDANYAQNSGYDADGQMDWNTANTWAANLVYGGYNDWRLAANTPVGADWNYEWSDAGITDWGYNITSPHSELSYMYYVNLGLKGYVSPAGDYQPDYGVFGNGTLNGTDSGSLGQKDVGPVKNLQSNAYWSGTAYAKDPAGDAWGFRTTSGYQFNGYQSYQFYAWAVRPGDVAAVPEPEVYGLLMAGLGVLGVVAKRRRSLGAS
jgi:hypothetical protein